MTQLAPPPDKDSSHRKATTSGAWLALAAALLGWMFDGAEMGLFSLVGRPAVKSLMPTASEGEVGLWFSVIVAGFLVGAATGGVLFGWLGDRIGRVRAMTLSVLTYAVFTGACGLAGAAWQVGLLRFIAALGMGGEWSLGVALVMEIWPNRSRAFMAGLIGAAANVGYLMVGVIGLGLLDVLASLESGLRSAGMPDQWVTTLVANSGWRIMMLLGTLPAVLTFFIRIFVPESEKWKHEQGKGSTSHWATRDLLAVLVGVFGPALMVYMWAFEATGTIPHSMAVRAAGTLAGLSIALIGYSYPVIRFFQRRALADGGRSSAWGLTFSRMLLGACLSAVALLGTWGATQLAPSWADKITENAWKAQREQLVAEGNATQAEALVRPRAKEYMLIWLSIGAIVGTITAALMGDWIGRRPAYCLLCGLSMASVWGLFLLNHQYGPTMLFWAFLSGTLTASFYGWLPLYLPELFPTSMRATGQGFAFNFGRILASIGVLQVGNLLKFFSQDVTLGSLTIPKEHPLACSVVSLVYLVGMGIIWLAPETKGKPLPE